MEGLYNDGQNVSPAVADKAPVEPAYFTCSVCGVRTAKLYKEELGGVCPDCFLRRIENKEKTMRDNFFSWTLPAFIIWLALNLSILYGFKKSDASYIIVGIINTFLIVYVIYRLTIKKVVKKLSQMRFIGLFYILYIIGMAVLGEMLATYLVNIPYVYFIILFLICGVIYSKSIREARIKRAGLQSYFASQERYLAAQEEYDVLRKEYDERHKDQFFSDVTEGGSKTFFNNMPPEKKFVFVDTDDNGYNVEEPDKDGDIAPIYLKK